MWLLDTRDLMKDRSWWLLVVGNNGPPLHEPPEMHRVLHKLNLARRYRAVPLGVDLAAWMELPHRHQVRNLITAHAHVLKRRPEPQLSRFLVEG